MLLPLLLTILSVVYNFSIKKIWWIANDVVVNFSFVDLSSRTNIWFNSSHKPSFILCCFTPLQESLGLIQHYVLVDEELWIQSMHQCLLQIDWWRMSLVRTSISILTQNICAEYGCKITIITSLLAQISFLLYLITKCIIWNVLLFLSWSSLNKRKIIKSSIVFWHVNSRLLLISYIVDKVAASRIEAVTK